jgi:hypothetical protein
MQKVESILNGFPGWRKARYVTTFSQNLFSLLSLFQSKIFSIPGEEDNANAPYPYIKSFFKYVNFTNLTLQNKIKGGKNETQIIP